MVGIGAAAWAAVGARGVPVTSSYPGERMCVIVPGKHLGNLVLSGRHVDTSHHQGCQQPRVLHSTPWTMRLARRLTTTAGHPAPTGGVPLPVLRLPTVVFPAMPISLPILEEKPHLRGHLTAAAADEIGDAHDGRLVLLADGGDTGVMVDLMPSEGSLPRNRERGSMRFARWGKHTTLIECSSFAARAGLVVHAAGGERLRLLTTGAHSPGGVRLAAFERVSDDALDADTTRLLPRPHVRIRSH